MQSSQMAFFSLFGKFYGFFEIKTRKFLQTCLKLPTYIIGRDTSDWSRTFFPLFWGSIKLWLAARAQAKSSLQQSDKVTRRFRKFFFRILNILPIFVKSLQTHQSLISLTKKVCLLLNLHHFSWQDTIWHFVSCPLRTRLTYVC